MFKFAVPLACALFLVLAIHVVLDQEQVLGLTRLHIFEIDRHLNHGELLHYTTLLILGLPAALLLSNVWSDAVWTQIRDFAERAGFWLPSLLAGAGALCISRFVTHGAWFTDDEQAYLFQMQSYGQLRLAVQALQPEPFFHHPFVVVSRVRGGVQYWSGIYPILQPALMSLSRLLGHPLLCQWLSASLIAYHTGRLCEQLSGARRLGILAAWLCATSPLLIGLAATYHTSIPCCLLSVLGVRALLAARERPSLGRGVLVGLCAGAAFLTRSLEGALLTVVFGAALSLLVLRVRRDAWSALFGYAVACALAGAVYVSVNLGTTGEWLKTSYVAWGETMGRVMGFGQANMMWGRTHTPFQGLAQTFTTLARLNSWLFGWPGSLLLALCALLRPFRERCVVYLLAFSGLQLAGYVFLPFGSVHDFGAAYHVWHLPWITCVTMILVKNARPWVPSGARLVVSLSLLGLLAFWPLQLDRWHALAELILAPVRAAEAATQGHRAVVLWSTYKPFSAHSWVHWPPAPFPGSKLVWMHDVPGADNVARHYFPDRRLYRLVWEGQAARVIAVPHL